jgi:ABC-2 type transport system permease protein
MIAAAMRAVATGFVRDRGALWMAFLVPVPVFLVFAAAFAGTDGARAPLAIAIADEQGSPDARRLAEALERSRDPEVRAVGCADAPCVRAQVRSGRADAGLVIGGRRLGDPRAEGPAPLRVVRDPARAPVAQALAGLLERTYVDALPDAALRDVVTVIDDEIVELTADQWAEVEDALAEIRRAAERGEPASRPPLIAFEDVAGGERGDLVAYYAGAIAVLFVLFSANQAALGAAEADRSPLLERLCTLPGGLGPLLLAQFAFLVGLGAGQVVLMFAVAWVAHGVDLPRHLGPTVLVALAAAAAAAGIALAVTGACRTRRQAEVASNVAALVLSAVGGSMIPRFLMPDALRAAGWLTPNAWALDAFGAIYWRGEGLASLALPIAALLAFGLVGLAAARLFARRTEVM